MKIKQRLIVSLLLTFPATFAMGQDDTQWQRDSLFYSDAPAMEIEEDTTDVQTLDEIINEQMEVNNRLTRDRHFEDVWGRRSYLNISYSSAQLVPQQSYPLGMDNAIVPTYKTNWGLALTIGRSYRLHKPAISNILQFSMDYTFVDFNLNHYDSENGGVNEYDSSKKWKENGTEYYYLPWNGNRTFNNGCTLCRYIIEGSTLSEIKSLLSSWLQYFWFVDG